jgi:signal transduction histidine kinase
MIQSPGDELIFSVADDGPGLSAAAMAHAFDPFFSEKPAGRQSGLGLAIARGLAQAHQGELRLLPGPGGGTVASLRLSQWRVATPAPAQAA